jgi:hypothetical protein
MPPLTVMTVHVKSLLGIASLSTFLQVNQFMQVIAQAVIPNIPPNALPVSDAWVQMAEHLTLTGALMIAVFVLWKQNVAKDQLLIQSTKTVTDALAQSTASNVELRKVIQDSADAKIELSASIGSLQRSVEKLDGMSHDDGRKRVRAGV